MNSEAQAADEVYKLMLNGTVYLLKFAGTTLKLGALGVPAVAGLAQSILHQDRRTRGRVKMERIIAEGKGLCTFLLPASELETFKKQAVSSKLLFAAVESEAVKEARRGALESGQKFEMPKDGMITIYCAGDKASLVNSLILANRLHGRQIAEAEQVGAEQTAAQEMTVEQTVTQEATEVQRPITEADIARHNEELLKVFGVESRQKQQPETEQNPTKAAERENPSENGSQRSAANATSEKREVDMEHLESTVQPDLDIEHLESAVVMENDVLPEQRQSVRAHLAEIKADMARMQQAPEALAEKEQSFTARLMGKVREKNAEALQQKGERS